jgi:hypothetical protein
MEVFYLSFFEDVSLETFFLALGTYIMEYRMLAAVNIVITVAVLWLLINRYSNRIRTFTHIYFAILSFYPLFLLGYYIIRSLQDIDALRLRAAELIGVINFPDIVYGGSAPPAWLQNAVYLIMFSLMVIGPILWLYDIKKKATVWDYSGIPRWQKYLTWILVFYGLTYLHALPFVWFMAGIFKIFLMYGLYPCPINLVQVALLAPLAPKVNKPLYVVVCLAAIMGAVGNQIIGISVNLDAMAVTPVGIYGLVMLWRSIRKK